MKLTDDSLAQLYTIPEDDWALITKRVEFVISLPIFSSFVYSTSIVPIRELFLRLPHFSQLEDSCRTWNNSTFPEIVNQSKSLNYYANQSIQDFEDLKGKFDALVDEATSLPDPVKQEADNILNRLYESTVSLNSAFSDLAKQITTFREVNMIADSELLAFRDDIDRFCGSRWETISDSIQKLENVNNLVLSKWQAITSDLEYVVSNKVDITTPFLRDLNIDVALASWNRIQIETAAFTSMADKQ